MNDNNSIPILYPSPESLSPITDIETDEIFINEDIFETLNNLHRLPGCTFIQNICKETFPKAVCLIGYDLEMAIRLYRQVFYSTRKESPNSCNTNTLPEYLDHINQWSHPIQASIIDFGGAFETEHLNFIRYIFRNIDIYSIDLLYKSLDLLVFSIDQDPKKWFVIPVYSCTTEVEQQELSEYVIQEFSSRSSVSNKFTINNLQYYERIRNLEIYDPYSEVFDWKKIHFIDNIGRCSARPFCLFMAYRTFQATPNIMLLRAMDFIDDAYTKIDIDHAQGGCRRIYDTNQSKCFGCCSSKPIMEALCTGTRWESTRAEFNNIYPLLPKTSTLYPMYRKNQVNWLEGDNVQQLLYGIYTTIAQRNLDDSIRHSFRITRTKVLWNVNCLDLTFLLLENNITPLVIQQFIEQNIPNNISPARPTNFVQECLHELLGSISRLRIYINSETDIFYSSILIQQLRQEDPNLDIQISLHKDVMQETSTLFGSTIILVFESNRDGKHILVCADLSRFLNYLSTCTTLEEVRNGIQSSAIFVDELNNQENAIWHQNLSCIYIPAFQQALIEQTREKLSRLGLSNINFIPNEFPYIDHDQQPQISQAVIRFCHEKYIDSNFVRERLDFFDKWLFDTENYKFTGPVITLFPNVNRNFNFGYEEPRHPSDTCGMYSLRCGEVLTLIQWRN
ncbi:unnamed protein product [Adineta ricciae]|uniref:Uncharacterized protein n=1 Tax=Adineta ricciae TaxID=249248 RepID=A0A815M4D3_ADIRI|nr:unnamed protein product [Adineta ricciae]CAF1580734.1 unnamed protein product [Adineta ricciae]